MFNKILWSKYEEIKKLDPVVDNEKIMYLSFCYQFPLDLSVAMQLGLFRTFSVESIAKILCDSHQFERYPVRRFDDTDIILSEIIENGYSTPRGIQAIKRLNEIHSRFDISNQDYLYVLSAFIFEPIRWVKKYGWRDFSDSERLAYFLFWSEVGKLMNIKNIPDNYAEYEDFNISFEKNNFKRNIYSERISSYALNLIKNKSNWIIRPFILSAVKSILDDSVLSSCGIHYNNRLMRAFTNKLLRFRATLIRCNMLPVYPVIRTNKKFSSYPDGYTINKVGPK